MDNNDTIREEHEYHVRRSEMETWKAASLIIGVEIAERLAYAGIQANLVIYFTQEIHQETATAATNVNIWTGVSSILPFLGAFVADSYLGRYKTTLWFALLYFMGLMLMSIFALLKYSSIKVWLVILAVYLAAVGQGCFKPCLQSFGADQFSDQDDKKDMKGSFFNWWYFGGCLGSLFGSSVIMYVEEDVGWGVGFGILAASLSLALLLFLCGRPTYVHKPPGGSPITNIFHVLVATYHKRNIKTSQNAMVSQEPLLRQRHGIEFRFLDKAAVPDELDDGSESVINWRLCTVEQVTEVKNVLCLFPIWVSLLSFGVVFSQSTTFFTKQGNTMQKKMGWFEIPAASLQSLVLLVVIFLIPVYDRIFVPLARKVFGNERGITILQRIGTGMIISATSMAVAALVEIKRINTAKQHGLVDVPKATIPLSIFWLLPQYVLFGIADVFTMVGMQEFFYDETPDRMKSLGIAIFLSVIGVGSILSGILISAIQNLSCKYDSGCWISSNLNKGHLDYFYWFLAAISAFNFFLFLALASSYKYRKQRDLTATHQAL